MNIITNGLRNVSLLLGNSLQMTARGYAVPKKLPFQWVRPVPPLCWSKEKSGDLGFDVGVKPDDPIHEIEESKELEDANEIVKKLVSVEYNGGRSRLRLQRIRAMRMVQRHKFDYESPEARLAEMTVSIARMQECLEMFPYNKKMKVCCKELIEKRQKILKKLREIDYPLFEFLLERLNIIFRPGIRPEHYHRVERKHSHRLLIKKHVENIEKKKLDDYRKILEAQHKDFFREKAETLEFIRKEEIACGAEPTVTEEEIEAAKQKVASFL